MHFIHYTYFHAVARLKSYNAVRLLRRRFITFLVQNLLSDLRVNLPAIFYIFPLSSVEYTTSFLFFPKKIVLKSGKDLQKKLTVLSVAFSRQ